MAYTGRDKRRQILRQVQAAIEKRKYFSSVRVQMPPAPPANRDREVYITRIPEQREEFTAAEVESVFRFAVVALVSSNDDIDLLKSDAEDRLEEALMSLQTDSAFRAIADIIAIDSVDPGPLALFPLGIEGPVVPPEGAIRLDVRTQFTYTQF